MVVVVTNLGLDLWLMNPTTIIPGAGVSYSEMSLQGIMVVVVINLGLDLWLMNPTTMIPRAVVSYSETCL